MAQLLQDLQAITDFLNQSRDHSAFPRLASSQAEAFRARILSTPASVSDAAVLLQVLKKGPWPPAEMSMLESAIQSSVTESSSKGGRTKQQHMPHLEDYLTEGLWNTILSETIPFNTKIRSFVEHLGRLGIRHPHAVLTQHIVAILLCGDKSQADTPEMKLCVVKERRQLAASP